MHISRLTVRLHAHALSLFPCSVPCQINGCGNGSKLKQQCPVLHFSLQVHTSEASSIQESSTDQTLSSSRNFEITTPITTKPPSRQGRLKDLTSHSNITMSAILAPSQVAPEQLAPSQLKDAEPMESGLRQQPWKAFLDPTSPQHASAVAVIHKSVGNGTKEESRRGSVHRYLAENNG